MPGRFACRQPTLPPRERMRHSLRRRWRSWCAVPGRRRSRSSRPRLQRRCPARQISCRVAVERLDGAWLDLILQRVPIMSMSLEQSHCEGSHRHCDSSQFRRDGYLLHNPRSMVSTLNSPSRCRSSGPLPMRAKCIACVVLTVAAAAVVSGPGCTVGPNFHKPAAPAGAGYTTAPLPEATASADVLGWDAQRFVMGQDMSFKWWEAYGSPALNSLVEQAFRANPTITAAQAALRQAQELVRAQQGFFFPTVAANYNFDRQKLAGNVTGTSAPGAQGDGSGIFAYQSPDPNPDRKSVV